MKLTRLQTAVACVVLAGVYFILGKVGLTLALGHPSATPVWPPSGISLAALLLMGRRLWPGVALGALAVNLTLPGPWITAAVIAVGNTLEPVISAFLIKRLAGGRDALREPGRILRFILLGPILSTTVSASIGVGTLALFKQGSDFGHAWITWWLGDAVSQIVVAPMLLSWNSMTHPRASPMRAVEAALLMAGLYVTGQFMFGGWLAARTYPITFLTIPVILWAAFHFHQVGAATASLVLSVIAIRGTLQGFGPFSPMEPKVALLLLQTYMGCVAATGLITASLVSERLRAGEAIVRLNMELERRVKERTRALEQAVDELNAFAYTVAHDLRAPLRAMSGFGQLIAGEEGLTPPVKDYAGRIVEAARRMDELIQDLLEYGKLSQVAVDPQAVDMMALVNQVVGEMKGDLALRKADVMIEGALLPMKGHAVTLAQVVTNLLSNAVKFVAPGVAPRVRIRMEPRDGGVRLWVEDNGIGIAPEHHERVFHMFERLHGPAEYPGTGIGLAIVRKAMERMGGRSGVESSPGAGSRFWVELPAG